MILDETLDIHNDLVHMKNFFRASCLSSRVRPGDQVEWMSPKMPGFCRNSCRDSVAIPLQPFDFKYVSCRPRQALRLQHPLLNKRLNVTLQSSSIGFGT